MLRTSERLKRAWIVLACGVLLFAQHVGLSHAIWHSAQNAPAHEQQIDHAATHAPASGELSKLCALDAAFAQVLGAGPLSCHPFSSERQRADVGASAPRALLSLDKLTPRSRGPPPLS